MENDALFGKVSATICDILAQHCSRSIEFDKEINMFGMISVTVDKSNNREPREYLLKITHTLKKPASENGARETAPPDVACEAFRPAPVPSSSASSSLLASIFAKSSRPEMANAHELLPPPPFPSGIPNFAESLAAATCAGVLPPTADNGTLASRLMAIEMLAALEMQRTAQGMPCDLERLQREAARGNRMAGPLGLMAPYDGGVKFGDYGTRPNLGGFPMDASGPLGGVVSDMAGRFGALYGDLAGCLGAEENPTDGSQNTGRMKVITDLKQDRRALRHDPQTAEVFSWIRTMADTSDTACQICGKQFTNKWSLRRHLLQHTGYKPYLCVLCNRSFYRRDHFSSHMIAWHKNDPNRSAATKNALLRHGDNGSHGESSSLGTHKLEASPVSSGKSGECAHDAQMHSPLSLTSEETHEAGGAERRLGDFACKHAARKRRSESDERARADASCERSLLDAPSQANVLAENNNQCAGLCDCDEKPIDVVTVGDGESALRPDAPRDANYSPGDANAHSVDRLLGRGPLDRDQSDRCVYSRNDNASTSCRELAANGWRAGHDFLPNCAADVDADDMAMLREASIAERLAIERLRKRAAERLSDCSSRDSERAHSRSLAHSPSIVLENQGLSLAHYAQRLSTHPNPAADLQR